MYKITRKGVSKYVYQRIKDLREDADKTQTEIANELFMHVTQYRRYETGARDLPLRIAIMLSKYYDVSLDYLAGLTNHKKNPSFTVNNQYDEESLLIKFETLSDQNKGRVLERIDVLSGTKP